MKEELMLNVATIGTNFIVDWFLKSVQDNQGIRCCAMYTRKKEHAEKLAEKYHIEMIYTDLDEMLSNPEIDIIYIASPNSLHYTYAEKALTAGKHVFCEKPLVSDNEQCAKLYELAEKKQRFLFEAIVTLHAPNYHLIREYLLKLGDIKLIQSNFSQYSSRYDAYLRGENPNVFSPEFSGGCLGRYQAFTAFTLLSVSSGCRNNVPTIQTWVPTALIPAAAASFVTGIILPLSLVQKTVRAHVSRRFREPKVRSHCIHSQANVPVLLSMTAAARRPVNLPSNRKIMHSTMRSKNLFWIINENDLSAYRALSQESKDVMQVYETLRKGAHIHFSDDEK